MTWKFNFQRSLGLAIILICITIGTVAISINIDKKNEMGALLEIVNTSGDASGEANLGEYEVLTEDQEVKITKGVSQISIPRLDIKAPIVDGTDSYSLSISAGHFTDTAKMGKKGNFCIAGHRSSIYNCIFNDIDKVNMLEPMYFTNTRGKTYIYYVTKKFIVEPSQLEVLSQNTREKECTIVTCTDNGARRLIIRGKMLSKKKLKELRTSYNVDYKSNYVDKLDEIGYLNYSYRLVKDNIGDELVWHTFGVSEKDEPDFSQKNMTMFSCDAFRKHSTNFPKHIISDKFKVVR